MITLGHHIDKLSIVTDIKSTDYHEQEVVDNSISNFESSQTLFDNEDLLQHYVCQSGSFNQQSQGE